MTQNSTVADPSQTVHDHKQFLGHPVGLFVLFFTEMWERFSYYGMRALLVLYLTKYLIASTESGNYVFGFAPLRHLLESMHGPLTVQPLSSHIYGLYTAFVYLTPFFGGLIADRYWGQRRTVYVGGVLMAIGHFLMAMESAFLIALLFLIVGNGCFKPNVSTQVGSLYPPGDSRRDSAFTIFYMGVNLGAVLSPLVCGTLGQVYGWHYGFGAAGVGMVVGLAFYAWGQKYLAEDKIHLDEDAHVQEAPLTQPEKKAIWGLVALAALNIVFWAVYEQQGNTIQIFADSNTDWHIFGFEMPSTWFQSVNPLFIFIMGPVVIWFWGLQSKWKKETGSVAKMAIGCVLLGLSFLVMMFVTKGLGATDKISFMWLVLTTFIFTVGELYLSPVGLSLVTKAAPARYVSMMMGMWYLSSFFGNYLSGYIGAFYESMSRDSFFLMLVALGVGSGLVIFALEKPVQKAVGQSL